MGGLELLLKPFRFVENEFGSIAEGIYSIYNSKTGKNQYDLSNFYLVGSLVYFGARNAVAGSLSITSFAESALSTGIFYFLNYSADKSQQNMRESETKIKNRYLESYSSVMKLIGRLGLVGFVGENALSVMERQTAMEITDLHALLVHFESMYFLLISLTGYTAAIDTNKPRKSKIAELFANTAPQKAAIRIK